MKMHASLHTSKPKSQSDSEAYYAGYKRVDLDYEENIGAKESALVLFPEIAQTDDSHPPIRFIAFGENERGDGHMLRAIECIPNVNIVAGNAVRICIANIPEPLPEGIHPVTAVIWHMINRGELATDNLPPPLFEAINDELARVGMPILKIVRSATAKMDVEFSQIKSLKMVG